ncbi:M23 family metallopeptidase [Devosia nitrariae]|uniref:M23ase beta-sheet core domain-containing protein n=1 Tax=Devosia nitrariae TaxID=2071872 RepID=A0ABQ5W681_9HYPH|nr:M23 family metallopeptidase [Devosia nitrariae]GLQ55369.1 hypothetical protein GCM10010862_26280 [Devosia nitrariae]
MRWLFVAAALSITVTTAVADDAMLDIGRAKSEAFLAGQLDEIWGDMTPQVQQLFGTPTGLETFRESLASDFGTEIEILSEEVQPGDGAQTYVRTARWSLVEAPILMQWAITDDEQIAGLLVKPVPVLAESRFLDYQTKTSLRLPFEGEWFVVWGGRTLEQNYHAADRAQRFALDVLIYKDGITHDGDAQVLENYYCWDEPILAPADGEVVAAIKDLPDNAIGATDAQKPAGNHVVLDFGNGEFGFLGHMRQGSIDVAAGDRVSAGQEVGRCGNSGNTSEPHLHFHLQTTPNLSDGEGLPAYFEDYVANDEPVDRGEPLAGQYIRPQ